MSPHTINVEVAVEVRNSPQDTTWVARDERATLYEIAEYNQRHGWSRARPKDGM